ncbi:MAG: helix-turn-helix transcriptional regulator [Isosphaeraceae bacterium]
MSDDNAIARRMNLMRLLSVRRLGATIVELAREMGTSPKTIRRDLGFLQGINYPVEGVSGERGCKTWRYTGNGKLLPLTFSYDEAAALYLARQFLEPLAGTNLGDAADSALRKIRCTLGEKALEFFDQVLRVYHVTSTAGGDYTHKTEIIDCLDLAIAEHTVTRLTYQSQDATQPAARDVHPYKIVEHKGSLYLFAFDPIHQMVRHYKVDRIEQADATKLVFEPPRDFDIQNHLACSFGIYGGSDDVTVVVKILPAAARHAAESQRRHRGALTHQRDGSVLVRFQLSSTVEVKGWALSFGANAIVLEPEELRAEIARELEHLLTVHYARSPKT